MPKRSPTHALMPARDSIHEEARETVSLLRGCRQTINVVLVALTAALFVVFSRPIARFLAERFNP
mgnify:CR=1 FL=1